MKTLYVHSVNFKTFHLLILLQVTILELQCHERFACSSFGLWLQTTTNEHRVEQVMIRSAQRTKCCAASSLQENIIGLQNPLFGVLRQLEINSLMLPLQEYLKRIKYRARYS